MYPLPWPWRRLTAQATSSQTAPKPPRTAWRIGSRAGHGAQTDRAPRSPPDHPDGAASQRGCPPATRGCAGPARRPASRPAAPVCSAAPTAGRRPVGDGSPSPGSGAAPRTPERDRRGAARRRRRSGSSSRPPQPKRRAALPPLDGLAAVSADAQASHAQMAVHETLLRPRPEPSQRRRASTSRSAATNGRSLRSNWPRPCGMRVRGSRRRGGGAGRFPQDIAAGGRRLVLRRTASSAWRRAAAPTTGRGRPPIPAMRCVRSPRSS